MYAPLGDQATAFTKTAAGCPWLEPRGGMRRSFVGARDGSWPIDTIIRWEYPCAMQQTMLLKLAPTTQQHQALLDTMHAFNEAANSVAARAFAEKTANKFALQTLVYGQVRSTSQLPAQ